jgi:hypothetical protein
MDSFYVFLPLSLPFSAIERQQSNHIREIAINGRVLSHL